MKFNGLTLFFILMGLLCGEFKKIIYILLIVIFHELGHVFIILLLGYKIKSVEIFPFGGITKIDKKVNDHLISDILIAIFGVLFQGLLFLFFKEEEFIKLNYSIMLFNMLPIVPLDGSKVLLEIFNIFMPFKKAIKINNIISFIAIGLFFIINYKYNLDNYLIICFLIYKTIEEIKNSKLLFYKFILERKLYDIKHRKVVNKNINISRYQKDVKYYYFDGKKIIDEKTYLLSK